MASQQTIERGRLQRQRILRFVQEYWATNGMGPSLDEVAAALELGRTTVRHHVLKLEAEGALRRNEGRYRSLRPNKEDQ